MTGTFEGLGVPVNGAFKRYAANGTTECWDVSANGALNMSYTNVGADNFISVTISDGTTISSGYTQAFHANVTTTNKSGSAQVNCFAADLTIGAGSSSETSGVYIYVAETGTADLTQMTLACFTGYLAAFGSAATLRAGVHIYSLEPQATLGTVDAALAVDCSGTGTFKSLLYTNGTWLPEYFLHIGTEDTKDRIVTAYTPGDTAAKCLRMNYAGTVYNIPIVADSCS